MSRSLQRNDEIIKKLQSDKHNLSHELTNIRELNTTIENKKEQTKRQLHSKEIENEQLQAATGDMKIEIDMLRTQIKNEKAVVKNLEELIASLREKDVQTQIKSQEKDSDLHLARDRAHMNELKVYVSFFCFLT